MTPSNIKSGFRATGVYPFNSEAIPEVAFAPSSVTNQDQVREPEDQQENNVEMPSTSQEEIPSSAGPSTSGLQKKRLSDTSDDSSRAEDSSFSLHDESSNNGHNSEEEAGQDVTTDPNMSFTDMLQTPDEAVTTAKKHRKPAINSRAQVITKDLFREHENKTNAPGKIRKRAGKSKATGKKIKLQKNSGFASCVGKISNLI
ncbi:hypothetical protein MML48_5g00008797 [Holotrichia oblita]|uniref:Uncharacterized protein n=1 Tax=Holotrichia oblita TaxID=644536 RepID=A0ACB9T3H2_HOLOL|nr:hypothetical protein MML48_5g00008797 [Holotrichia oblita]